MKIKEMSNKELKDLFNSCYQSVHISECFGTKDMLYLELAGRELEKRGYQINESMPLITKKL